MPSSAEDDGTLFQFTACGLLLEKQGFWASACVWVYMTRTIFYSGICFPVCLLGAQAGMEAPLAWAGPCPAGCQAAVPRLLYACPYPAVLLLLYHGVCFWNSLTCVCKATLLAARVGARAAGRPPHCRLHCSIVSTGTACVCAHVNLVACPMRALGLRD